jgi:hypothetical protein
MAITSSEHSVGIIRSSPKAKVLVPIEDSPDIPAQRHRNIRVSSSKVKPLPIELNFSRSQKLPLKRVFLERRLSKT